MDTLKDQRWPEALRGSGRAPWQVWDTSRYADPDAVVTPA